MNRFLASVVLIAWGLWFGGAIALFLFVISLFRRDFGAQAAPVLFATFGTYQLILAAVTLVAVLLWWLVSRSRLKIAMLVMLALAAALATLHSARIALRMQTLRLAGQTKSAEFRSLHRWSERLYTTEAALLLSAGVMLSLATNTNRTDEPGR